MKDVVRSAIASLARKAHKRDYAIGKGNDSPWPDNVQAFLLAKQLTRYGIPEGQTKEYLEPFYEEAVKLGLMYDSEDEDIEFAIFEASMKDIRTKIKQAPDQALELAIEQAKINGIPPEAENLKDDGAKIIASVCRELQRAKGEKPFFLSQTDAGLIINRGRPAGAGRLLLLTNEGILKLHKKGHTGSASEFFFLGDLSPR